MSLIPYPSPLSAEDAAHFLRRTAFGATDSQIRALVGQSAIEVAHNALNFSSALVADNPFDPATGATPGAMIQLNRAAWLYEMLRTPTPLREKLALMWSNHFVIGTDKVRNYPSLANYLSLLRQHAAAPNFETFALQVAQTPAMLRYLDNDQNKKSKPNENFSRELLELFTLGIGSPERPNYTEQDVREGARALTGWDFKGARGKQNYLQEPQFVFLPQQHDDGPKTYLGHTGNFSGQDIIHLTATHPQAALRVCWKLHRAFVSDQPDMAAVQSSAQTFSRTQGDVGLTLTELLSSAEFYAKRNRYSIIRGPAEFVVGSLRALGSPALSVKQHLQLLGLMGKQGQVLLQPDTVKGWDGGREWINDSTLLTRMQVAAFLVFSAATVNEQNAPTNLALLGSEGSLLHAALQGLGAAPRTYLTLVSPEFQLA